MSKEIYNKIIAEMNAVLNAVDQNQKLTNCQKKSFKTAVDVLIQIIKKICLI